MHPLIRVVVYLAFAGAVAWGSAAFLGVAAVAVVFAYWGMGFSHTTRLWPMLWRMRWLFLSILLVYVWAVPVADPRLVTDALISGATQVAKLAVLIAAVVLLLSTTSRPSLVSALYWLASPLRIAGFDRARFALRIVLVMERVTEMRDLARDASRRRHGGSRVMQAAAVARDLFVEVVGRAHGEPLEVVEIELDGPPPRWQWMFPIGVVGGAFLVERML